MRHWLLDYCWPLRHSGLIRQLARREILARYQESMLGTFWAVLTPLMSLVVYTLVFRHIFNARWGNTGGTSVEFALQLYAGLAVFNFCAECLSRAPRLVLDQPNLVKKVVFPLEILPWILALSAFFHLAISLGILLLASLWINGLWPPTLVALPLVWLPLLPLALGFGWLLAALGVFLKDINQVLGTVISLLMFLSPVFYPVEALPQDWRPLMKFNPLAQILENTRHVVLDGVWPDWNEVALLLVAGLLVALAGAAFFKATRHGFADVL